MVFEELKKIDVLCVGHASYDLVFSVERHPLADEKLVADEFLGCGGGPAANAAVMVAKLGYRAAFAGFLGNDLYGDKHLQEFIDAGVETEWICRGDSSTPLSVVMVKPDGKRTLINFKGNTLPLSESAVDYSSLKPGAILFDGHELSISLPMIERARKASIPTVLDAGSLHGGTSRLMSQVDYLVASEKFAGQLAGSETAALSQMAKLAPVAVITLGERGLIWQKGAEKGALPAFQIVAKDTTGAGDAFHGAFAAAIAAKLEWQNVLRYASAAGALCCTKVGARPGLPDLQEHQALYAKTDLCASG